MRILKILRNILWYFFSSWPSFMYFQIIINTCLLNTIPNFQWYKLHFSRLEFTHRRYWNQNFSLWDMYFFNTKESNFQSVIILCFSCTIKMIISFTSPWYKFASLCVSMIRYPNSKFKENQVNVSSFDKKKSFSNLIILS